MNLQFNCKQHSIKLALASALALGSLVCGTNASAATTNGTATATVVLPITITAVNDLRFGSFSTSAAGQTMAIATDDTATPTGLLLVTSTHGAASFTIGGEGTLTYAITLPATSSIAIAAGTGTSAMAVGSFVSNPSGTGALTAGTQTLLVGATLTTVASQVAGAYTGTFPVTVDYN
jgi:hypothetical protein